MEIGRLAFQYHQARTLNMDGCDFRNWLIRMADLSNEVAKRVDTADQYYIYVGREQAYRKAADKLSEERS